MHIIIKLDKESRDDLEAHLKHMESLRERLAALNVEYGELQDKQIATLAAIIEQEKKADSGDINASRELLALKDQSERINSNMQKKVEETHGKFREDMNLSSRDALGCIKALLRPQFRRLRTMVHELIAPFCLSEPEANHFSMPSAFESIDTFLAKHHVTFCSDLPRAVDQHEKYYGCIKEALETGRLVHFEGFTTEGSDIPELVESGGKRSRAHSFTHGGLLS